MNTKTGITAGVNDKKNAFHFESDYSKSVLLEWFKKYKKFRITPEVSESLKGRRYLEGAIIPEYCKFQYNIDPRDPNRDEARRLKFKQDFNYEIITNRHGEPERIPISSKGRAHEITNRFTEWANENGCKVPNPDLYKLWRDKWQVDQRFPTFHDFLYFLKLDCDAMPSRETLDLLDVPEVKDYLAEYYEKEDVEVKF